MLAAAAAAVLLVGGTYVISRDSVPGRPAATSPCGTESSTASADSGVVIGSADFPESQLVAQIYRDAHRGGRQPGARPGRPGRAPGYRLTPRLA